MVGMKKTIYGCSRCQKTFPRKWNAERHVISVHKGLSKIGSQFGNEVNPANSFRHLNNPTVSYTAASKAKKFKTSGFQKKLKESVNPMMDIEEREDDLLYGNLEKMIIPFEKLEKLFFEKMYRHEPPEKIDKILTNVIILASGSSNPAKVVQDYLTSFTRSHWTTKMISCVARSMGVDAVTAFAFLKSIALDEDKQIYVRKLSGYRNLGISMST